MNTNTLTDSSHLTDLPVNGLSLEPVPLISIIAGLPESPQRVHFSYQVLNRTLDALLNHRYSDFDAHTTTNCCHGMALLVQELILLVQQLDLAHIHREVRSRLDHEAEDPQWPIPQALVHLCHLYMLKYASAVKSDTIHSTHKRLLSIANVEVKFCNKITKTLQKYYSNTIALRYEHYLNQVSGKIKTCDAPVELWGRYASHSYLRSDDRGLYYTASLYAMQVVLGYLIHSKSSIAIVNDILDNTGKMSLYIRILQGDGKGNFSLLELDEHNHSSFIKQPVVVFRACAHADDPDQLTSNLDEWLHRFPNLVLAHELTYPQFPKVNSQFCNAPIVPEEDILQASMIEHGQITGVSSKDPSLYCLNHIYTASIQQMLCDPTPDPHSLRIFSTVKDQ